MIQSIKSAMRKDSCKKTVLELVKNWLEDNRIEYKKEDFGLSFLFQHGHFIVFDPYDDPGYLCLVMPCIDEFDQEDKSLVLAITNQLTKEKMCLKACVRRKNEVWLSIEQFLNTEVPLDSETMFRLLDILLIGRREYGFLKDKYTNELSLNESSQLLENKDVFNN